MSFIAHQAVKIFIFNSSKSGIFHWLLFSARAGDSDSAAQLLYVEQMTPAARSPFVPASHGALSLRPEQNFEVKADDLEQICELGRGAYGVVDQMRHVPSGLIMAVKVSQGAVLLCRPVNCPLTV